MKNKFLKTVALFILIAISAFFITSCAPQLQIDEKLYESIKEHSSIAISQSKPPKLYNCEEEGHVAARHTGLDEGHVLICAKCYEPLSEIEAHDNARETARGDGILIINNVPYVVISDMCSVCGYTSYTFKPFEQSEAEVPD